MPINIPPIPSDSYPQDISGNPTAYGYPRSGGGAGPEASWNGIVIPGNGGTSVSTALSFNQNVVSAVCSADPYCCDNTWDPRCVQLATILINSQAVTAGVVGVVGVETSGSEYLSGCNGPCSDTVNVTTNIGTFQLSAGEYISRGGSSWNNMVDAYGNYNCFWYFYNYITPDVSKVKEIILYFDTYTGKWVCRVITFAGIVNSYSSGLLNGAYAFDTSYSNLSSQVIGLTSVSTSGAYNPPCLPCAGTPNRTPANIRPFNTYHKFAKAASYSALYFSLVPISGGGRYTVQTSQTFDTSASTLIKYYGTDSTLSSLNSTFSVGTGFASGTILTTNNSPLYFKVYPSFTNIANSAQLDDFAIKYIYLDNGGPGNFINSLDSTNFSFTNSILPSEPCFVIKTDETLLASPKITNSVPSTTYTGSYVLASSNFTFSNGAILSASDITSNSLCSLPTNAITVSSVTSAPSASYSGSYVIAGANFNFSSGGVLSSSDITSNSLCSLPTNAITVSSVTSAPIRNSILYYTISSSNFNTATAGSILTQSNLTESFCSESSRCINDLNNFDALISYTKPITGFSWETHLP